MMQKSTTFTMSFRVKKCYFHYDFACKKVPLSLRYAKKYICNRIRILIGFCKLFWQCLTYKENKTKENAKYNNINVVKM
jgi:hypothetical protein